MVQVLYFEETWAARSRSLKKSLFRSSVKVVLQCGMSRSVLEQMSLAHPPVGSWKLWRTCRSPRKGSKYGALGLHAYLSGPDRIQ